MLELTWKLPGGMLALAYVFWAIVVSFFAPLLEKWNKELAASLLVAPFLVWLATAISELRCFGRNWWKRVAPGLLLLCWIGYVLIVVPFLLEEDAALLGSESLGVLINALFALSVTAGFDQLAVSLCRAEQAKESRSSCYVITLVQLIFPPFALWFAHPRIAAARTGDVGNHR